MKKTTALEALAECFRRYDLLVVARYDEQNNSTSLEIQAGGSQLMKVELVGSAALMTKHDIAIAEGLFRH